MRSKESEHTLAEPVEEVQRHHKHLYNLSFIRNSLEADVHCVYISPSLPFRVCKSIRYLLKYLWSLFPKVLLSSATFLISPHSLRGLSFTRNMPPELKCPLLFQC